MRAFSKGMLSMVKQYSNNLGKSQQQSQVLTSSCLYPDYDFCSSCWSTGHFYCKQFFLVPLSQGWSEHMINSWVQTIFIKNTGSCKVVVSDGKQDQGQLIMNTLNNLTVNHLTPMIWLSILPFSSCTYSCRYVTRIWC